MPKSAEVTQWLKNFDHPLKDAIDRVREIVLGSDKRVGECIKWKSPTFTYQGNIASINPNTKKKVSLMFHQGGKIPGKHPQLVGGGGTVKYMYFADLEDVDAQRSAIESVIAAWCDMKTAKPAAKPKPKTRAAGKSAKLSAGIPLENLELYEKLVATNPSIDRKGAANPYTSLNGNMFSFLTKEQGKLALRLPAAEREAFMKKFDTTLCETYGTVMKEYVVVPDSMLPKTRQLKRYFDLSYAYAGSLKPKPTTRKPAAKKAPGRRPT